MPGMMDTILDLGLNDDTTQGLATSSNDDPSPSACQRRFVEAFRSIVGVDDVPGVPLAAVARLRSRPSSLLEQRSRPGVSAEEGSTTTWAPP